MAKKVTVKNFEDVLDQLKKNFREEDLPGKKVYAEWLEEELNSLLETDFFGTEGQLDPRGDRRDD